MRCCVPFCRNSTENVSKTDGISFHAFPDEDSGALRAQWLRSLGMQGQVPASAAVCSQHFLREDMRDARGDRSLCAGAVPTAVQVCLICLDTDSPMISMSKYNLGEAYVHLTGYSLCNEGNLRHILCMKCAQRLTNISKFREKSLRACTLLMDLIEKYQMITPLDIAHLQSTLNSSQACCSLGSDPCDLHVLDGTSTYAQTELQLGSCLGMPQARESADRDSVDIIRQIALLDKAQFIRQLHQHHSVLRCWVKLTRISLLEDIGSFKTRAMSSFGETSLVSEDKTVPDNPLGPGLNSRSQHVFDEVDQTSSLTSNKRNGKKHIPTKQDLQDDNMSNISLKNCFVKLQDIFKELESDIETTSIQGLNCCETTSYNEVLAKESVIKDAKSYERELPKTAQREIQGFNIDNKFQREELPATNKDRYTCDICNNDFLKKSALVKHIMSHTGEQLFSCELCKYSTKYKNKLAIHMEAHKSEKFFACALCEYKCTRKSSLLKHLRSQTCTKTLTCKLCQYECSTKRSFIKHKREHSLQKHFACKLCDYKGARNVYLKRHMKIHSGVKPFACNLCEYKSALKDSLRIHMRIHTGEKPYACHFCPYKANFKSNIVDHIRTHTGEKPYACTVCQYKCKQSHHLTEHMRRHTGEKPFTCKLCHFKFATSSYLAKHMKNHLGKKQFSCSFCEYKCIIQSNLVNHLKKIHPDK